MKKYRINTTISAKHYALLKKYVEKYDSQQSVLEHALESLENNPDRSTKLLPEEELWISHAGIKTSCMVQKDCLKWLMNTADMKQLQEIMKDQKPIEFAIEFNLQKPLKECSLVEVIDGMVITSKMSHWFDTVDYSDDGDHYTLKITHSLGLNNSKMLELLDGSVFKTYGTKTECTISEKTLFMKIFKNF
jgi:hypothetical protein